MRDLIALDKFSILVVDDTYSNILLIRLLLEENGVLKIFEARSAEEAYALLKTESIDAILLDVMMPNIDGITACTTIRKDSKNDLIPIIMVTANSDDKTLTRSFEAGADDFITKPLNETVLISRLQSQLQRIQLQKAVLNKSRFSAMDEMTSILAHQWRQPLSLITTVSNTLQTRLMLDQLDNEELYDGLHSIEGYATELSELISSFKSNFSSVPLECLSLENAFAIALDAITPLIKNTKISITKIDPNIQVTIKAKTLINIVANILKNGVEALIRDHIEVEPSIILGCKIDENTFTINITDNANGIPSEILPYIFDPYFSTKVEKNGKGLGLFFAKIQLENEMDGTIEVKTRKGKTTFSITLPKHLC